MVLLGGTNASADCADGADARWDGSGIGHPQVVQMLNGMALWYGWVVEWPDLLVRLPWGTERTSPAGGRGLLWGR